MKWSKPLIPCVSRANGMLMAISENGSVYALPVGGLIQEISDLAGAGWSITNTKQPLVCVFFVRLPELGLVTSCFFVPFGKPLNIAIVRGISYKEGGVQAPVKCR